MTPSEPTPESKPAEHGNDKTRLTESADWVGDSSLPPTGTAPTPAAGTARSPFGPGNEPPGPEALPASLQGRYRLIRVLGQGGFANVYLAHDGVLDQEVAIKVLRLGLAAQNDRDRFLMEARIGAKLRHPNIATVFDILSTADGLQMVMEYYPGGTLTERIRNKGALHPREAIDIIRQVALALAYAHRHDVIHRDVKPANIFMAGEGIIKLGDFGIASHSDRHEFTQTGMIIGTPLYMAPEQSSDSRDVDPRTDIYALGLTLYHALTGRPPRVVDMDSIPEVFRRLMRQATAPERAERLVSAEQFIAVLDQIQERLVAGRPAGAGAPAPAGAAPTTISSASTPTSPPVTTETAILTPTPPPLLVTPTPTPQARAAQPPAQGTVPHERSAAAQAETVDSIIPPERPAPAPAVAPAPPAPAPPAPARRRWPVLLGAAAVVIVLFLLFTRENRFGNSRSKKVAAVVTPQVTPTATATPVASPPAKPPLRPPLNGPGAGKFKKGEGRPPLVRAAEKMAEMKRKRTEEMERILKATPSAPPAPKAKLTPALTPADDLPRIEQAFQNYLREHPGVASSMEILREGGQGLQKGMAEFQLTQARQTLLELLKKTPEDPILNMIVGFMYLRLGYPDLAKSFFDQAGALDRKSPAPLNLTPENMQRFRQRMK